MIQGPIPYPITRFDTESNKPDVLL